MNICFPDVNNFLVLPKSLVEPCGHLTVSADSEDSWKRFCLSRTRLRCLTLAFLLPDINTLT